MHGGVRPVSRPWQLLKPVLANSNVRHITATLSAQCHICWDSEMAGCCHHMLSSSSVCYGNVRMCMLSAGHSADMWICILRAWQEFGRCKATAMAELIQLAEQLGCRHKPRTLRRWEAVCLGRGAADVLAAMNLAGGAQALAAADPDAAACLCRALMVAAGDSRLSWLPAGLEAHVHRDFAALGPGALHAAIADAREGMPGALQDACYALRLIHAFLQANASDDALDNQSRSQMATMAEQVSSDLNAQHQGQNAARNKQQCSLHTICSAVPCLSLLKKMLL
jgi:hypothetical protein